MKKVLLHICCGVCAFASIERLKQERFLPQGLFFNPNIQPQDEYSKRKDAAAKVAQLTDIDFIDAEYSVDDWQKATQAYAGEAEGGKRCDICFEIRLQKAFEVAQAQGFDYFTTTLTISPHKKSEKIFEIGKKIGGDKFLPINFKKQDGFKKSIEAAKKLNLYRQNYCGCIYSLQNQIA